MVQKAIFDLPIGAGQYTEQSERGAAGRWYSMDKVRFRKGLAEKIGGWSRVEPQFIGACRRLKDWSSLDSKRWVAIATDTKLYVWQDGTLHDITPLRRTETLTAPFETFTGETRVRVTDTNNGAQEGDYVTFSNTIVGASSGLSFDGEYVVDTVIDPDTYEVTNAGTAATGGSGEGGTAVLAEYQISAGATTAVTATGYGTGPYGREGYGNARTGSTLVLPIRTWSLDTWGEDLLANPRGGAMYWWDRSKGTGTRAVAFGGDAPPNNEGMIVSQRDRHVIALGAFDYFNDKFDPLLIRWCSTEDLNDWVPTSTNTSGDLRLYSGSKIVTGVRSRLETVVFTDVSVHTMPFFGGFEVFGLNTVGENVSILGPNAAVPIDARVVFMAESDFYIYDGIVKVLPCDVRNLVYDYINVDQRDKVYGGLNREFNEVWWFYPSFDTEAWVQQPFDLRIPPGYELANNLPIIADDCWDDVLYLAKWEGADAATTYTELKQSDVQNFYGNAQLDTAQANYGSASLLLDGTADGVQSTGDTIFGLLSTDEATVEGFVRFNSIPGGAGVDVQLVNHANQDNNNFEVRFGNLNGTLFQVEARFGFGNVPTGVMVAPSLNTWYYFCAQRRLNGATWYVDIFWGLASGGTASRLSQTVSSNTPTSNMTGVPITVGAWDNASTQVFTQVLDGHIDDIRFTACARYGNVSSYAIPGDYLLTGGGPSSIGYSYGFNSAGFTEVTAVADNNYEHDYFLTNDEPIITPEESEYAVELDVNPDIGAGVGRAGICFLRTDLTGQGETDADDCQQLMFELNYDDNRVEVWKKTAAGVAAPVNQGANTVDFTTLTGSAMALGTKYILTAQFDTPTVTLWVDGVQAFQFALDATELTQFASGTMGLHQAPGTVNDLYRFYNLAAGPVGVLTASDFDISPIEVNRYVMFNYEEGTWATGRMARTAWADRSPLFERAYAAGTDNYIYEHEVGTDANGVAMESYIESFDMEIPNAGEELMHVDQLIPDFLTLEGSVDVRLTGRKYPAADRISKGPYTVDVSTRKVSTRIRARQVAIRISSNDTGDRWRMGQWRGRAGPHGRRG